MASRLSPPKHPVELELDGETLTAEAGEPIAVALIAADKVVLCRSPKLHRPHGPYCLRGGCDGCLVRVDGEPNVAACMVPCRGGERIETQNVLGTRKVDLLEATDWFFPRGIDHHHLLAGVPAASFVVQKIARHVAGLGELPDEPRTVGTARREQVDVLIVGGGAAGLLVAKRLAASRSKGSDFRIVVADDSVAPGGSLRARGIRPPTIRGFTLYERTTAVGVYEREVLLTRSNEAIVVRPHALVLATGVHDGVIAFPGNDLPGVFSARAVALLAHHHVAVGTAIGIVGQGPYGEALRSALGTHAKFIEVPLDARVAAEGRGRLTSIVVDRAPGGRVKGRDTKTKRYEVDALAVEAPGAPSFELAEQAGVNMIHDASRGGYLPVTDARGRSLPWLWCAGELTGTGSSLVAIETQALRVAADVETALHDGSIPR